MHRLIPNKVYLHFVERTRLGRLHQGLLYATVATLWMSGALWLWLHYRRSPDEALGTSNYEPLAMKIHGALAMLFLGIFGSLVPNHLRRGWVLRLNRPSGAVTTAASAVLVISGWALYYLGDETLRASASALHWGLGLLLPVVIAAHVFLGRRKNRSRPVQ